MKCIRFLFFIFLTFFLANLCAQNYLNQNSKWYTLSGDTYDKLYYINKFQVIGDSSINDTSYYKIHREYDLLKLNINDDTDTTNYFTGLEAIRLLRENSGKFYTRNSGQDELIIDFNLGLGSEVDYEGNIIEIYDIDTILIGNEFRKIFKITSHIKIYEGIGTNKGLFKGLFWDGFHSANTLICYQHDGVNYQLHESFIPGNLTLESCDSLTFKDFNINTSSSTLFQKKKIEVFPNPFSEEIIIDLDNHSSNKVQVSIYDLNGRTILTKICRPIDYQIKLHLPQLNKGIYFLRIEHEGYIYNEKLIKF